MSEPGLQGMREEKWDEGTAGRVLLSLAGWGAKIPEAMDRFLEDKSLYLKSVMRFARNDALRLLLEQVEKGQYEEAFETVHSMKGTASLLSLEPLAQRLVAVTEALRYGEKPDPRDMKALSDSFSSFAEVLERALKDKSGN